MAHKKGVGSTDNGRDSNSKRLGVKIFGNQSAKAGNIIVRQRGTKFHPGNNVYMGKDFTLHAKVDGKVHFQKKRFNRTYVSIIPEDALVETAVMAGGAIADPVQDTVVGRGISEEPVATEAPEAATSTADEVVNEVVEQAAEVVVEAPEAKVEAAPKVKVELPSGKKIVKDDLKAVEGIGPKIEELLNADGINTWQELSEAPVERVQKILDEAGPRYRIHSPETWSKQAKLAFEEKWAELEELQDRLKGGKEVE